MKNANGCRIPLPYGKTERQSFITRPISGVLYSIDIGEWHAHGDKKLQVEPNRHRAGWLS